MLHLLFHQLSRLTAVIVITVVTLRNKYLYPSTPDQTHSSDSDPSWSEGVSLQEGIPVIVSIPIPQSPPFHASFLVPASVPVSRGLPAQSNTWWFITRDNIELHSQTVDSLNSQISASTSNLETLVYYAQWFQIQMYYLTVRNVLNLSVDMTEFVTQIISGPEGWLVMSELVAVILTLYLARRQLRAVVDVMRAGMVMYCKALLHHAVHRAWHRQPPRPVSVKPTMVAPYNNASTTPLYHHTNGKLFVRGSLSTNGSGVLPARARTLPAQDLVEDDSTDEELTPRVEHHELSDLHLKPNQEEHQSKNGDNKAVSVPFSEVPEPKTVRKRGNVSQIRPVPKTIVTPKRSISKPSSKVPKPTSSQK